jgi:hypothetical protein
MDRLCMIRDQNLQHSSDIVLLIRSYFQIVLKLQCLGRTEELSNKNYTRYEIAGRINSENACHNSGRKLLSAFRNAEECDRFVWV